MDRISRLKNYFKKKSIIAIYFITLCVIVIDLGLANYNKKDRVIEYDIHSYYAYLPALFIYDDIKLEYSFFEMGEKYYLFWPLITEDNKYVIKTSMGLSMLYAPFFFAGHLSADIGGFPQNGFSPPYKIWLLISAIFYLIIGLHYLRKILKYYGFSENVIAIVLILLGIGTNLLLYSSISGPMAHVYSFCLYAAFFYYTIKWYEKPSVRTTIVLGLLLGFISLIRPTNAIIVIVFLLYGVGSFKDFVSRISLLFGKYYLLILMAVLTVLIWIPQIIYWKNVTGEYLFYSYGDEKFFFNRPEIIKGLFSFRKGWLVYTPMMAFSLIGIFMMRDYLKKLRISIILFFFINIYIIFSWWCWWYGGSFGQRALIESYAILAIPFSSFVKFILERKNYLKIVFFVISLFFIWLNVFQTFQKEFKFLHYDGMTKTLYFKQFGRMELALNFYSYVDSPDYNKAMQGLGCERDYSVDFKKMIDDFMDRRFVTIRAGNGKYLCADKGKGGSIYANRESVSGWETFYLINNQDSSINILSVDRYFCAQLGHLFEVTATKETAQNWETFRIKKLEKGKVAIMAFNNKYLSLDTTDLQIYARSDTIGELETFLIQSRWYK